MAVAMPVFIRKQSARLAATLNSPPRRGRGGDIVEERQRCRCPPAAAPRRAAVPRPADFECHLKYLKFTSRWINPMLLLAKRRIHARLRRPATKPCEKCGLTCK